MVRREVVVRGGAPAIDLAEGASGLCLQFADAVDRGISGPTVVPGVRGVIALGRGLRCPDEYGAHGAGLPAKVRL